MGATYVDVTIRNPAAPGRTWTGSFLVDTGAFDSLVPRTHLESIGLAPRGHREYTLADGQTITKDITVAEIEFEGERVGGTIVYGEEGAEPLLGVTALESGGFEVNPREERLNRLPAVLLNTFGESPLGQSRRRGAVPTRAMPPSTATTSPVT